MNYIFNNKFILSQLWVAITVIILYGTHELESKKVIKILIFQGNL